MYDETGWEENKFKLFGNVRPNRGDKIFVIYPSQVTLTGIWGTLWKEDCNINIEAKWLLLPKEN